MREKNRKLKRFIAGLAAMVAIIAAVFALLWSGIVFEKFFTPGKVENVQVDVTYSGIALKWEGVKHAKGYEIVENAEGGMETVGLTNGECEFTVDDYDRDKPHEYRVVAFGHNPLRTGRDDGEYEGEPSDPVEAYYDKSKYAQMIPVLSYHDLSPAGTSPESSNVIAQDKFDEQMKYLHDNGFTTLTLDEFRQWHAGKREFPVKSCVITFDDGFYETYWLGYPVIKKYGLAAVVFSIGHHIEATTDEYDPNDEKSHYVGTDVIEKLRSEYPRFSYESHTYNMHKRVNGKMPVRVFTYDQMVEDCEQNKQFGFRYMAYPWGAYSDEFKKALKDTGYEMAFAYRPFQYATRDDDPYAVSRVKIYGKSDLDRFIRTVTLKEKKFMDPEN